MSDQPTALPTTMRAWRLHDWGQPLDVLKLDDVPVPEPGPGERVRVQGIAPSTSTTSSASPAAT